MALFDRLRKRGGSGRKANETELENLKDEVRNLTERARDKKREYDRETGKHLKAIIAGELTLILDELDAGKDHERIITRNLRQAALTERKRREAKVAQKHGVSQEAMDEVAIEYEDAVAQMRQADRAAEELEKVAYRPEREKEADLDERMAEMEIDAKPEARERQAEDDLPEETLRRMKELDLD